MTNDDLDRILSSKDDDIPTSPKVTVSIMEAIRSEVAVPPLIPFPWKRALPGLVAAGVTLAGLLALVVEQLSHGAVALPLAASLPTGWAPIVWSIAWSALALLLSLISVTLSVGFASR
jgi:hypothetical protein